MQPRTKRLFLNVRTEGSLLPSDLLQRITDAKDLKGLKPEDYGLTLGETLSEAINRSWTRLQSLWGTFKKQRAALPESDAGTTLTRRWLQVLFQELQYGSALPTAEPIVIEEKPYPISHQWGKVPIHLVSFRADLDSRSAITGAKKASPHSLVQELLNRSDAHLWAFLSNGLRLRVLRDNASLTRQAFVEFDLEGIFDSEAYADFRLLWLLCHQSRVAGDKPEHCWLEKWTKEAQDTGRRALEQLRQGVQQAIESFGQGFIAHRANTALRARLQSGGLSKQDYYRQLLRLIYRLIFLFVAEDRDLLLDPAATPEARALYLKNYSGQRLRRLAERHRGSRHHDLYQGLRLVFEKLGSDQGCPPLGLPALGSFLFSPEALPDLQTAEIGNEALLDALRRLALTSDKAGLRLVDFRNLGSEELGSVYESLLELHPEVTTDPATFRLITATGNERKTTGSYYTPDSLIQCLLDSALDPVLHEASNKKDPSKAILALKVCDPACGSGHFLLAAAHRIAKRLAAVRTGEEAPAPDAQRNALRDVIGHCLYGIDLNPMAVELCKVSLWLEALEPGKPLSFLDAHIQCGNSLLGTTPPLIAKGLPEEAFIPLEGDDKDVVSELKKRNKKELTGTGKQKQTKAIATPLFSGLGTSYGPLIDNLSKEFEVLEAVDDTTLAAVHAKETRYKAMQGSEGWRHAKLVADAWCAAFVWEKTKARLNDEEGAVPITHDDIQRIIESPILVSDGVRAEIERISDTYRFLHPHIAFPHVFLSGQAVGDWAGGFDVVLGNPPWERIKLQEKEWFATRVPSIASAPNTAHRGRLIQELEHTQPDQFREWILALRTAGGESHIVRNSGRFPLCGRGDINTFAVFAEAMRDLIANSGFMGMVVPTSIAFADTTKFFFQDVVRRGVLKSLYSFFEIRQWFPDTDSRDPFCLLTISGPGWSTDEGAELLFDAEKIEDMKDADRRFTLNAQDIQNLNPNTGTCALFKNRMDADITKGIYRRVPVLIREATDEYPEVNPWEVGFLRMFDMALDSDHFRNAHQLELDQFIQQGNRFVRGKEAYLPLFEAKMLHHFNHRWGDYAMRDPNSRSNELPEVPLDKLADPNYQITPNNWVPELEVKLRSAELPKVMIEALRNNQLNVITLGLAYWAFGNWLLREGLTTTTLAMTKLFDSWVEFNQTFQWAQLIAPTQLGLCPDGSAYINPQGPHFIPAVPLKDLQYDKNSTPCWYESKRVPLERLLKSAEDFPFSDEEWIGLQISQDAVALAEWILEKRTPSWFFGWRDIGRNDDTRTVISSLLPRAGVGHKFLLMVPSRETLKYAAMLSANLSSFVLDYIARQKVGGSSLTYFYIKQFAFLTPEKYEQPAPWANRTLIREWMLPKILELTYTSWDLQPFAKECGFDGPPFMWDEQRRFRIRCELDAAYFRLYGLSREEVNYVLGTFDKVCEKDQRAYGFHRTKETILSIFDELSENSGAL